MGVVLEGFGVQAAVILKPRMPRIRTRLGLQKPEQRTQTTELDLLAKIPQISSPGFKIMI